MPKFVTIGYGDEAGYQRTDEALRSEAHAHDAMLQEAGVEMGVAGDAVQVRNHQGSDIRITKGPFMSSALPVAGFSVLEAADMSEAIDMVSKTPCAIANGVVEVLPLK